MPQRFSVLPKGGKPSAVAARAPWMDTAALSHRERRGSSMKRFTRARAVTPAEKSVKRWLLRTCPSQGFG